MLAVTVGSLSSDGISFFAINKHTPPRQAHAVSILSIYNIKCRSTALNLTGQEQEVHLPDGHEIKRGSILSLANERLKLL